MMLKSTINADIMKEMRLISTINVMVASSRTLEAHDPKLE